MLVNEQGFNNFLSQLKPNDRIGLSIDLETWNRRGPGFHAAAIVPYNPDTSTVFEDAALVVKVDLASLLVYPDMLDPSTIRWWMTEPPQAARDELFGVANRTARGKCTYAQNEFICYEAACYEILLYMKRIAASCGKLMPLGNGAVFDVVKLEASMIQTSVVNSDEERPFPYDFWDIRDLRELKNNAFLATGILVKNERPVEGTAHKCLDDAVAQAKQAVLAEDLMLKARDAFKKFSAAVCSEEDAMKLAVELLESYGVDVEFSKPMGIK